LKKIIVSGILTCNPIEQFDSNGGIFTVFSLAIIVDFEEKRKTDWVKVICIDKLAVIANQYLTQGTKVLIIGYPDIDLIIKHQSKPSYIFKVYAHELEILYQ